jgi:hypothetical protein
VKLALFIAVAVILSGCAVPRRLAKSEHRVRMYKDRPDGLIREDIYIDIESGGGWFVLTESNVQMLTATHTNQTALGGGSYIATGPLTIRVDPQTSQIIEATGTAAGNIIGAAAKTAAGVP